MIFQLYQFALELLQDITQLFYAQAAQDNDTDNSLHGSSCLESFKWVAQEHPMYNVFFDNVSVLIACVKC